MATYTTWCHSGLDCVAPESIEECIGFEDDDTPTPEPVKRKFSLEPVKDMAKIVGVHALLGAWHISDFFAYYYMLLKNWYSR
jgi:hypothetical protein